MGLSTGRNFRVVNETFLLHRVGCPTREKAREREREKKRDRESERARVSE